MDSISSDQVPPGHTLIESEKLIGPQALAWAVCASYEVPAAILEGVVHVQGDGGKWEKFDPRTFLRSLVAGRHKAVLVPDEIARR